MTDHLSKQPETKEKRVLSKLHEIVRKHPVLTHEYLQRMQAGDFPDINWAFKDFAQQYYAYSRHFRSYVGIVLAKLKEEKHRKLLMHNIEEENGILHEEDLQELEQHGIKSEWVSGIPHVQLWERFRKALGIPVGEQSFSSAALRFNQFSLNYLAESTATQGVVALGVATESIVPSMYEKLHQALKKSSLQPQDYVFFPLHYIVDEGHAETLDLLAEELISTNENTSQELEETVTRVLDERGLFYEDLLARAMSPLEFNTVTSP